MMKLCQVSDRKSLEVAEEIFDWFFLLEAEPDKVCQRRKKKKEETQKLQK